MDIVTLQNSKMRFKNEIIKEISQTLQSLLNGDYSQYSVMVYRKDIPSKMFYEIIASKLLSLNSNDYSAIEKLLKIEIIIEERYKNKMVYEKYLLLISYLINLLYAHEYRNNELEQIFIEKLKNLLYCYYIDLNKKHNKINKTHPLLILSNYTLFESLFNNICKSASSFSSCLLLSHLLKSASLYSFDNSNNLQTAVIAHYYEFYLKNAIDRDFLHIIWNGNIISDECFYNFIVEKWDALNSNYSNILKFLIDGLNSISQPSIKIFDLLFKTVIEKSRQSTNYIRSLSIQFFNTCFQRMCEIDCFHCLNAIFHEIKERSLGLDVSESRCSLYLTISQLSSVFPKPVESTNNAFIDNFKTIFKHEESEICYISLMRIFKNWAPLLECKFVNDTIKFMLLESQTSKKSDLFVALILETINILPLSKQKQIFNENKIIFHKLLLKCLKPPYNALVSQMALDVFTIAISSCADQQFVKDFYNISNINIIIHARNFSLYSESYFDSVIRHASISILNNEISTPILDGIFFVLFHCQSKFIDSYFKLLFTQPRINELASTLFISFIPYLHNTCLLYQQHVTSKNAFFSWTNINDKRIYVIFLKLLTMVLFKIRDINFVVANTIKLLPFISVTKNEYFVSQIVAQLIKFLKDQPNFMISSIYTDIFDSLLKYQSISPECHYYATKGIISLHFDIFADLTEKILELWLTPSILNITHEDISCFESSDLKIYNNELNKEFQDFINLLPSNFKYCSKKFHIDSKSKLFNMPICEIILLFKDKSFIDLSKITPKLIRKLEQCYDSEMKLRQTLASLKESCTISFWVIKAIIDKIGIKILSLYYPLFCEKLFQAVRSPFLCSYASKCLLILGEKLLDDSLLGRMLAVTAIRMNHSPYKLSSDLISVRLEIQVTSIVNCFIYYLSIKKKHEISTIIGLISFLQPIFSSVLLCDRESLSLDHFTNVSNLMRQCFDFKEYKKCVFTSIHHPNRLFCDVLTQLLDRISSFNSEKYFSLQDQICNLFNHLVINCQLLCNSVLPFSNEMINVFIFKTIDPIFCIRQCCVLALDVFSLQLYQLESESWTAFCSYMLLNSYQSDSSSSSCVKNLCSKLLNTNQIKFTEPLLLYLIENTYNVSSEINICASKALYDGFVTYPELIELAIGLQIETYYVKIKQSEILPDINDQQIYASQRLGIINSLKLWMPLYQCSHVKYILKFIFEACVLDTYSQIQNKLIDLSVSLCSHHGKIMKDDLLLLLDKKSKSISKTKLVYNHLRQCIAIMMITMYDYLSHDSPLFESIQSQLLVLLTSSKKHVQKLIAFRLPCIFKFKIENGNNQFIDNMINQILNPDSSSNLQRGYALSIGILISQNGLQFLQAFKIIEKINILLHEKKSLKEQLACSRMIKAIYSVAPLSLEPFCDQILIKLIHISVLSQDQQGQKIFKKAASTIVTNLTSHCLANIIPQWLNYSEKISKEYLAHSINIISLVSINRKKAISCFLPRIITIILNMLRDSSENLVKFAENSLRNFVSSISTHEFIPHKGLIISTLKNLSQRTSEFLQFFNGIKFSQYIDTSLFSLLMPIILSGLNDNNPSSTKIISLNIVCSISFLVKQSQIVIMSSCFVEKLKTLAFDSLPQVREKTAIALGTIIKYCDIASSIRLLYWFENMLSNDSLIIQNGSAHSMAEVLGALNPESLSEAIDRALIVIYDTNSSPAICQGYLLFFSHLPSVFEEGLKKFLHKLIPPIIKCLSDVSAPLSNAALLAGQNLVSQFDNDALEHIVAHIDNTLLDPSWIIRLGSIKLLREVILTMSGTVRSDLTNSDDFDNLSEESGQILQKFSSRVKPDIKNKIIAYLYMNRCDTDFNVRSESFKIWKTMTTSHSSEILVEILPNIIDILLDCFSRQTQYHLDIAEQCLTELTNKTSDKIKKGIIPIVINKFYQSIDDMESQLLISICIFIKQFITIAPPSILVDQSSEIIEMITKSIFDHNSTIVDISCSMLLSIETVFGVKVIYPIIDQIIIQSRVGDRIQSIKILNFILLNMSKRMLSFILTKILISPIDFEILLTICMHSKSIITQEQTLLIINSMVNDLCSNVSNDSFFKYSSNIIHHMSFSSIKLILLKVIDATNCMESDRIYVLSSILLWCCETNNDLSLMLNRIHTFCMSLLCNTDQRVCEISMKIYQTIVLKDDSHSYLRRNLEFFLKEFNFKYGKYSANKPDTLCALCNSSIDILPIMILLKHSMRFEDSGILINSINVLSQILKLSTIDVLSPHLFGLISSLVRVLTRNVTWEIKWLCFSSIKQLLDLRSIYPQQSGCCRLHILAPQLINVFVHLISNAPSSWIDKKKLCQEISSLQNLPFDMLALMESVLKENEETPELLMDKSINLIYALRYLIANGDNKSIPKHFVSTISNQLTKILKRCDDFFLIHQTQLTIGIFSSFFPCNFLKRYIIKMISIIKEVNFETKYIFTLSHIIYNNLNRFYVILNVVDTEMCEEIAVNAFNQNLIKLRISSLYLASHLTISRLYRNLPINEKLITIICLSLQSYYSTQTLLFASLNTISHFIVLVEFDILSTLSCYFIDFIIENLDHIDANIRYISIYSLQKFLVHFDIELYQKLNLQQKTLECIQKLVKYDTITRPISITNSYIPFDFDEEFHAPKYEINHV